MITELVGRSDWNHRPVIGLLELACAVIESSSFLLTGTSEP